jgi:membrane-bound metal-dependent hydrolase YbcI (DUF457 family)
MPLPLGHTAIGLVTHEISKTHLTSDTDRSTAIKTLMLVVILANLPDIDIIVGLLIQGNGYAFHRGPTHSLLFALIMGYIISRLTCLSDKWPTLGTGTCVSIISSHLLADYFLTDAPVSFFWPLEVHWSSGHEKWADIFNAVFLKEYQDLDILIGSVLSICFIRWMRKFIHRSKYRLSMGKGVHRVN